MNTEATPIEADTGWQERILESSAPELVIEHALRYRACAPLLAESATWVDLGTGAGVAAASVAAGAPSTTVLVDLEASALAEAARRVPNATTHVMDLCDRDDVARLSALLAELPAPVAVTAFEVVEHLADHTILLAALLDAVRDHDVTVVLSVPNDAFTGVENPYHLVKWGSESFEEMLAVLPAERTIARQVVLTGSAVVVERADGDPRVDEVVSFDHGMAPSHIVVAFGARHARLAPVAAVTGADTVAQRVWERQREADLAFYQAKAGDVPALEEYVRRLESR